MCKAYAKGPHLAHMMRRRTASATPQEVLLADSLLRIEVQLGQKFWKRLPPGVWSSLQPEDILRLHRESSDELVPLRGDLDSGGIALLLEAAGIEARKLEWLNAFVSQLAELGKRRHLSGGQRPVRRSTEGSQSCGR